ncbi:MAG: site-specific integrase [Nitrospirota bacterium]|nr:site-specific integrase [Nitrospirota bacterium]
MACIEKRTSKFGLVSFRVKIGIKGYPPQTATFPRLTDARRWAAETEAAIRNGRYFSSGAPSRHTLGDLVDVYLRDCLPHKAVRTQYGQRQHLAWWSSKLGAYHLAAITPTSIMDALGTLTCSPPTKIRYLAALSHVFTLAVKQLGWADANPVGRINKRAHGIRENPGRVRFLAAAERSALLAACQESRSPLLYPAVVLALSSGMRAGEQFGLTWDRVDLKTGRIQLDKTKNGTRRVVHVAGLALDLLREMVRRVDNPHVFPAPVGRGKIGLRTAWGVAVRRAGVQNFKWHDLRHSFASELAMNGATTPELAAALGHKTLQMVARYAHLGEAHQAAVVERMTERVFGQ